MPAHRFAMSEACEDIGSTLRGAVIARLLIFGLILQGLCALHSAIPRWQD